MNRKKDKKGKLSVATCKVTTETAPFLDFYETSKESARVLSVASKIDAPAKRRIVEEGDLRREIRRWRKRS